MIHPGHQIRVIPVFIQKRILLSESTSFYKINEKYVSFFNCINFSGKIKFDQINTI